MLRESFSQVNDVIRVMKSDIIIKSSQNLDVVSHLVDEEMYCCLRLVSLGIDIL